MKTVSGPEVWRAADVMDETSWRVDLEAAQAVTLADRARAAVSAADAPQSVDRNVFSMTGLDAITGRLHDELENGRGFALLSGLPYELLDYDAQLAITCGISDHIGRVVVQNYEGHRIVDVRDEGIPYNHQSRGYRSNKFLPFHTDGANLFCLACVGEAEEGGETIIVSAPAVYNALLESSPESLDVLARGFYHHRRGQHDPGEPPLSPERVPVFDFHDGLLHCCYNRNPIEWAEKEGVRLTDEEVAALNALDEVLARSDMQLRLRLKSGDCLFVNNFVTLHSRTEYVDSKLHRRHMLRVWMTDPASRRRGFSLLDLYVPARYRTDAVDEVG